MKELHEKQPNKRKDIVFYGVVGLCAVVIGVSGYALFVAPSVQAEQAEKDWSTTVYLPPEPLETQSALHEQTPEPTEADTPVEDTLAETPPAAEITPAPSQPEPATQTVAEQAPIWMYPVEGEVIAPYSGDALVFNDTMQDWRVHTGTDYATAIGDRVYAMADGTVVDVYEDGMFGTCVALSLPKGLTATYKGLSSEVKVQVDGTVRAGDVIGTVGDTNYAESAMAPHLHVELADATGLLDVNAYLQEMM